MPGENMIYNTGTISINGNTATGTGTNWTAAASQIRVSQTIIVLSNPVQMFQITAINSGTSLTVTPAASPALSGQKYGILITDSLSVDGLAQSMSQLINEYDENIGAWETFASTSANQQVTVTINGTSLSIPAIGGLARKGANSDITELKGLTTPLSLKQGGLGANNAADARTNLGLGSSATKDTTTDVYDTTTGRILRVGDFSFGNINGTRLVSSLHDIKCTGFYSCLGAGSATPATGVPSGSGNTRFIVLANSVYVDQFWLTLISRDEFYTGLLNNATQTISWTKHYNTANTTKTSDGTLKAASPIVKLFGDGSFQLNEESDGCSVTRLGIGEYLIEGCTGLNADAAWCGIDGGFDIPTDRNKQPLVWLDYDVNVDGSILVRTYHRTHPAAPAFASNELKDVEEGEPVDIPVDQFVSVRVEMPSTSIFSIKNQELIS